MPVYPHEITAVSTSFSLGCCRPCDGTILLVVSGPTHLSATAALVMGSTVGNAPNPCASGLLVMRKACLDCMHVKRLEATVCPRYDLGSSHPRF